MHDPRGEGVVAVAQEISIPAADGYPLGATLWALPGGAVPTTVAMINAGAGISLRYYDRFAAFLAASGVPAIVYDYRGIGRSRPPSLRGFVADVEDWGRLDCTGVLSWMASRFPTVPRLVIGHSVGGFVTGFAANGHLIDRMVLVSAHTGYWGDYAPRARPWMYVLWHAAMPAVTHVVGYFPGRLLRLLEDLPSGVALQWANRRRPDFWWYLKTPEGAPDSARIDEVLSRFHAVRAETLAIQFDDDAFATDAATTRILGLFKNCRASRIERGPDAAGRQPIGHFGFFRSRFRETLWPLVVDWIAQNSGSPRAAVAARPVPPNG
ncbi:MAG: alpha/beta fold hydrolase [Betaproteobacteria bacterium]